MYDHKKKEKEWQGRWEKEGIYSPDIKEAKKSFYNLFMFPYPSAEGLHAGHAFASTGSDVYGRFMRMKGKEVFQPIGYDSFGIHSENYALSIGQHPKDMLARTTKNYERQLKNLGHGYDWTKTVTTSEPDYYKWTQWIFVTMFKAGLAFRKKADVNWCPSCKTVLADEQVIQGECERCGHKVEIRQLEQWFFRITDYADKLLEGLARIDWPQKIKIAQRNWIGKSQGAMIRFQLSDISESVNQLISQQKTEIPQSDKQSLPLRGRLKTGKLQSDKQSLSFQDKQSLSLRDTRKPKTVNRVVIDVFTTRPDTLYGATFLAVSPQSQYVEKILDILPIQYIQKVSKYIKEHTFKDRILQGNEEKDKTGVFTGVYALNPSGGEEIPIWIADYVLGEVGTGAIMGVPAHDQRDFEFATNYKLKIKEVVSPTGKPQGILKTSCEDYGILLNSGPYSGLKSKDAIKKITHDLEKKGLGERKIQYHLRDWLISRQRYWGPPIPMVFCSKCKSKGKSWFNENQSSVISSQLSDHGQSDNRISDKPKTENLLTENRKLKTDNRNEMLHPDQSDWNHYGWWPEENLPVELPYLKDYQPKGKGQGPLAARAEFYRVACPDCGADARRETDVSDTFLDSSWYFLRYPSVSQSSVLSSQLSDHGQSENRLSDKLKTENLLTENRETLPWDPEITKNWLPVDLYFGGAEHAVLHLMYARFVWKVLYDLGYLAGDEPFPRFFAHGLMIKDGAKMSKSRGNVVSPDAYIEKLGADTLRLYLMFMGPMDGYPDFRDTGIEGMRRFIERVWDLYVNYSDVVLTEEDDTREVLFKMHQTIKKVTEDIEKFHYNTAISGIMEFVNLLRDLALKSAETNAEMRRKSSLHRTKVRCAEWDEALRVLAQLIAPFAPHLAEEVWVDILGEKFSIHTSAWPKFVPELVKEETVTIPVQVDGKLRAAIGLKTEDSKLKTKVVKLAKSDSRIKKWLKGKKVRKTIFVPGRLVNFVTK